MSVTVLHVITTLDRAGAELLLANTVAGFDPAEVRGEVICLAPRGEVARLIEDAGWRVHSLGMSPSRIRPRDVARLRAIVRAAAPDVVHTWMYHADLLGGVVARALEGSPVVWSLHQSELPRGAISPMTRALAHLNAALSWVVPARIVATSHAARRFHERLGYRSSRIVFVPTAFPTPQIDASARARLRRELAIPPDAVVIGRIGRLHPQKDYPTLLRAAADVLRRRPDAHLVLAGRGLQHGSTALLLPDEPDLMDRIHLLGERSDAPRLAAAFDVAVSSSSFGESTPLVIGEAMAAGVPVVTTDVGDCAHLVGDTGLVVPPREPTRLAAAILDLLDRDPEDRAGLGRAARRRIETEFSLAVMVERYTQLYREVAAGKSRP